MHPNPIRKAFIRMDWGRPIRRWVATCPECGERMFHGYSNNSRKTAKDWLHYHLKTHAGPGLETVPS